jgi:beta-mannosidase
MRLNHVILCISILILIFSQDALSAQATNSLPAWRDKGENVLSLDGDWQIKKSSLSSGNPSSLCNDAIITSSTKKSDGIASISPIATSKDDQKWGTIKVPSNWYSEGFEYSGQVWMRKLFFLEEKQIQKSSTLTFSAVDYAADVWLNGEYLGFHEGYFQPFSFSINQKTKPGINCLLVKVNSPDEFPDRIWSLHKQLIKGVLNHHDTRPGGAWSLRGQDANSGGIWDSVFIRFGQGGSIDSVIATPHLKETPAPDESAIIDIDMSFRSTTINGLMLTIEILPANFKGTSQKNEILLPASAINSISSDSHHVALQLHAKKIQRWWPYEEGKPTLYDLKISLISNGNEIDSVRQKLAFRHIRFDKENNSFLINGKRKFLRGTNYIGSPWLGEMSASAYKRDIRLMKEANINTVRVHAHIAGKEFYTVADEAGMLIWQDFPLQWGYDDSPEFAAEAVRQATDMLHLLGAHPAIIVWCGHNEPPWDADWMKWKYPDYNKNQNRLLTERVESALAHDRTRYVHPHSATSEHLWMGWYSGSWKDHMKPTTATIVSEFGSQALPDLKTLKTIIPAADLWPASTDVKSSGWRSWEYHNFQPQEAFVNAGITRGESLESFIKNSQSYQAKLNQLAAESYRRQRYRPVAAAFQFMFSETWPSINWGMMDFKRQPKLGYFALQRAFQPVLPSIEWDKDRFSAKDNARFVLWAINDRHSSYEDARISYRLVRDNKLVREESRVLQIPADTGEPVWELNFAGLLPGSYQLMVSLNADSKILGSNAFEFQVQDAKP